jgi:hypothetical protein
MSRLVLCWLCFVAAALQAAEDGSWHQEHHRLRGICRHTDSHDGARHAAGREGLDSVQDRVLNPATSSVSAAFLTGCWDLKIPWGVLLKWASCPACKLWLGGKRLADFGCRLNVTCCYSCCAVLSSAGRRVGQQRSWWCPHPVLQESLRPPRAWLLVTRPGPHGQPRAGFTCSHLGHRTRQPSCWGTGQHRLAGQPDWQCGLKCGRAVGGDGTPGACARGAGWPGPDPGQ